MKLIKILIVSLSFLASVALAKEDIIVVNAQGPTQSMTAQIVRTLEEANKIQNKYNFIMSFKTGAFESVGVKEMIQNPTNHLVTITNSVNESIDRGFVKLDDMVPVFSHGDACWAIITTFGDATKGIAGIKGTDIKDITVSTPAPGGASHLSALIMGEKYGIPVRMILFRSAYDGLLNMAANNGVNYTTDQIKNFEALSGKNPAMRMLAINCPQRLPQYPNLSTLKEQGINAPYVWHFTMASPKMNSNKRKEIGDIFAQAYRNIGQKTMFKLSGFIAPVYTGQQTTEQHWNSSITTLRDTRKKYEVQIKKDQ
jgi:tripartite-type tricarboxylate transporter receptor subunit TctC